jgi:2,3-bisphosphoglycerate-independent phosphoglycerate mutase
MTAFQEIILFCAPFPDIPDVNSKREIEGLESATPLLDKGISAREELPKCTKATLGKACTISLDGIFKVKGVCGTALDVSPSNLAFNTALTSRETNFHKLIDDFIRLIRVERFAPCLPIP